LFRIDHFSLDILGMAIAAFRCDPSTRHSLQPHARERHSPAASPRLSIQFASQLCLISQSLPECGNGEWVSAQSVGDIHLHVIPDIEPPNARRSPGSIRLTRPALH
jgi:hypothetical protein